MTTAAPGFFRPSPTPLAGRFVIDQVLDTPRCSVGLGYDLDELRPVSLYCPDRWSASSRRLVDRWVRVRHPCVLPCFGWIEIEGREVLALDRPASDWGRPLALGDRPGQVSATQTQAACWTHDVCQGLLALAEAGLGHGQLSPQTVLILQGSRACLTLPGIADCVLPAHPALSPRAGSGETARDIRAVGALLRFLLTGRMEGDAPLPAEIAAIVERCQTEDAARRYPGPAELAADLSLLCPQRRTDESDGWYRAARGSVLTQLRRYEQAEVEFTAAGPTVAQAHVNRATQHLILDRPDLAARDIAEALRLCPDHAEAHACHGEIVGQTDPIQGQAAFTRAIELDPTAARAFAGRAVLRARSGDRAAAEDLARARRLAPHDPVVHSLAGEVGELSGATEEALRDYRAALGADPFNGRVRTRLARLLEQAGKVSEAELEYNQALRDDPACGATWQARGALRQIQGRNLDALADYTAALEIRRWDARPVAARAALNRQLGRLDQAEADYNEVLRCDPDALDAHFRLGELLLARGQFRQALEHLDVVLAREASHAEAQRCRAEALAGLEQPQPATPALGDDPQSATPSGDNRPALVQAAQAFFRGDYFGCCTHAFHCLRDEMTLAPALLVLQSRQRIGLSNRSEPTDRVEQSVMWALRRYEHHPFETALIRLTLGEITASDALSQARSNVEFCQVCYYAGIRAGFNADFDRARRWLLEGAAARVDCLERQFAEVALGLCAPEELGTPATADLLVPFVLTGDADKVRAALAAFAHHDFEQTVELVEQMDLVSAWKKQPGGVRFTPELARAAMDLAERSRGMVPLEVALVLGRLAAISLGWLARPEDQVRLAVRVLACAPDRPVDRYLLHLAVGTAEVERPLCQLRGQEDVGLCHFYAAQARPPRAGDENVLRERGALLGSTLERAPENSIERMLAEWELEHGPPPFTAIIIPEDTQPMYQIPGMESASLAILLAEASCRQAAAASGEKSLAYAIALNNLAGQHQNAGDYPRAEEHYQRALDTIRQTVPGSENEARCLSNLARFYRHWGRHLDAVRMHRAALDIQRCIRRPVSPQDIGRTLNNLGVALQYVGDPGGSETVLRQSLWLRRTHESQDEYAQTLFNLAATIQDLEKVGEAHQLLLRAAEIRKRTLGPRHPEIAALYTTLAMACQALNQQDEAVAYAREALAIDDETIGPDHPQYAVTLSCLASAYRGAGNLEAAEEYFRRAIQTWRRSAQAQAGFGTEQLLELTLLLERKGDREGCWQALGELAEQEASDWLPALMSGDSRQRLAVMTRAFSSLSTQLSILARTFPDRQPEQTYTRVLRRKGLVGESIRWQREAVRLSGDPELLARLRTLSALRGQLAELSLARSDELTPQQWAGRFNLQQQAEAIERELADAAEPASRRLATVGPADIVPILGDAVLVEYVRYLEVGPDTTILGPRYLAFVLDPGPPWSVRLVPLGDAKVIDTLVTEFRRGLAGQELPDGPWMQAGRQLRAAVFDPIASLLGTRRQVVLALDGALNRISFATLPTDKGWLLDTFEFSHVSCGRDLIRSASGPRETREAVVLAGPEFDPVAPGAVGAELAGTVLFPPLPHAAA
jgi:tetratricopeptide (TPR) repeat protein